MMLANLVASKTSYVVSEPRSTAVGETLSVVVSLIMRTLDATYNIIYTQYTQNSTVN